MEGHIYIYGIISPFQSDDAAMWGEVNLKNVSEQLLANKDADSLTVHIRSEGGDVQEGYAIYDALKGTGKEITTIGEGIVASIATVVFLAGDQRKMMENSQFMIHNPWTFGEGDSEDLAKASEQLKKIEDDLAKFYNQHAGIDIEEVKGLMKNETSLTPEQAINYGFATEMIETMKAVALFTKTNNKMTKQNEEIEKVIDGKFDSFFDKIKGLFAPAKALVITTGDGTKLDFGDQIEEESQIAVGMTAKFEDGSIPDGDVLLPDGKTLVFENGTITEIKEVDDVEDLKNQIETLKAENETLKTQNAEIQAQNEKTSEDLEKFKNEFTEFKAQVKTDVESFGKEGRKDGNDPDVRKPFKD